jgi:hypothetical protein
MSYGKNNIGKLNLLLKNVETNNKNFLEKIHILNNQNINGNFEVKLIFIGIKYSYKN